MRMSPRSAFTYRDYEELPNDGRRYEIHDGELCVTPAPSPQHQLISGVLFVILSRWLDRHPGGRFIYSPLDVILTETTHRPTRHHLPGPGSARAHQPPGHRGSTHVGHRDPVALHADDRPSDEGRPVRALRRALPLVGRPGRTNNRSVRAAGPALWIAAGSPRWITHRSSTLDRPRPGPRYALALDGPRPHGARDAARRSTRSEERRVGK